MIRSLVAAMLLAACTLPCRAQEAGAFGALLVQAPHTMKLKQFDSTWFRMTVKQTESGAGGTGDMLSKLAQIGMMADGDKSKNTGMEAALGLSMLGGMSGAPSVCFTRGQTLAIGPETFLVAYTVEKKAPNMLEIIMQAEQTGKEPDMAALFGGGKWTEDTDASLSLVNVRSIQSLSGVRPFDLEKEIAEGGSGGLDLMQLMMLGMSKEVEKPAAPVKPQQQKPSTKPRSKP